jgi:hypothetical protein
MRNKPNFQNVQMAVTAVMTMTNNNEQPTFNYSKQTQSNPTYSELACPELVEWVEPISKGGFLDLNILRYKGQKNLRKYVKFT